MIIWLKYRVNVPAHLYRQDDRLSIDVSYGAYFCYILQNHFHTRQRYYRDALMHDFLPIINPQQTIQM